MHHGATYIHTRTRLVTTDYNTTGQGDECHAIHGTAPTWAVVSPPPRQATSTQTLQCWPAGAGRGGDKGASHSCREKAGGGGNEEQGPPEPWCPSFVTARSVFAWGEAWVFCSLRLTPTLPWSLGVCGGVPLLVPTAWGILECLGSQGRLSLPVGHGMERKGYTQTRQTRGTGEALVGKGKGWGQLGSQAAGRAGIGKSWDRWTHGVSGLRAEDRDGRQDRGVMCRPGVAQVPGSSLLSKSPRPSPPHHCTSCRT